MFVSETIKTLSYLSNSRERMLECSRIWSSLPAGDKESWKTKWMAGQKDYEEQLVSFKEVSVKNFIKECTYLSLKVS